MKKLYLSAIIVVTFISIAQALVSTGIFNTSIFVLPDGYFQAFKRRTTEVNKNTKTWKVAILGNVNDNEDEKEKDDYDYDKLFLFGFRNAVALINSEGGIKRKQIELLETESINSIYDMRLATAKIGQKDDVALLIGPFVMDYAREVRMLTYYYGLPSFSPLIPLVKDTDEIVNEVCSNFLVNKLSFFTTTSDLQKELIKHEKSSIVIISADDYSYSNFYGNKAYVDLLGNNAFKRVSRLGYGLPVDSSDFIFPVPRLFNETSYDAILYTGREDAFIVLLEVLKHINNQVPIITTNQLCFTCLENLDKKSLNPIYYRSVTGNILPSEFRQKYLEKYKSQLDFYEQCGILAAICIKATLEKMEYYDPIEFSKEFKQITDSLFSNKEVVIKNCLVELENKSLSKNSGS